MSCKCDEIGDYSGCFVHGEGTPWALEQARRQKLAAEQEARSWPEDASHENGKYYNQCTGCGQMFIGHKRRVTCKLCTKTEGS